MVFGPWVQGDAPLETARRLVDGLLFLGLHEVDDRWRGVHHDGISRQGGAGAPDLPQELVRDGGPRLNLAGAVAIEARLVQHAAEAFARALPRHFHEAELADAVQRRL